MSELKINDELQKYIEENIFPSYYKNDLGHNLEHIKYVIKRSMIFAEYCENINYDMVYTIASYHDIGHYIDAKNHEKVSSEMLLKDKNLKKFFNDEEIKIMADAVYDHRASMKGDPRSIYGKIVSSADRNTLLEVPLKRTYAYRLKHTPNNTLENIIEESRMHVINKFGEDGYANEKMYFEDKEYKQFLKDISNLAKDKNKFTLKYIKVNKIVDYKILFNTFKTMYPNYNLDELFNEIYNVVKDYVSLPFEDVKNQIIEVNNLNNFSLKLINNKHN